MSLDLTKILISSESSSNKLWKEGSGSLTIPARVGADFKYAQVAVAHGYPGDGLDWEVGFRTGSSVYYAPFFAQGSFYVTAYLDGTNLYIEAGDGSAVDEPAITLSYIYRILIP